MGPALTFEDDVEDGFVFDGMSNKIVRHIMAAVHKFVPEAQLTDPILSIVHDILIKPNRNSTPAYPAFWDLQNIPAQHEDYQAAYIFASAWLHWLEDRWRRNRRDFVEKWQVVFGDLSNNMAPTSLTTALASVLLVAFLNDVKTHRMARHVYRDRALRDARYDRTPSPMEHPSRARSD